MERDISSFGISVPKIAYAAWEIDVENLPTPLDEDNWEGRLTINLIPVAEAHISCELGIFVVQGGSNNFRGLGHSAWVAISGSPPIAKAATAVFLKLIGSRFRRKVTFVPPLLERDLEARIRLADGSAWRPLNESDWISIADPAKMEQLFLERLKAKHQEEAGLLAKLDSVDQSAPEKLGPKEPSQKKVGIRQHFRSTVALSHYQEKIEQLSGMPPGSVRFVHPDGTLANPSMHVGTLRKKWDNT